LYTPGSRLGLLGFLLSGLLMSSLGAILPAWGYHIRPDFLLIGTYFLVQILGVLGAAGFCPWLLARKGIGFGMVAGALVAFAGFLLLALSTPPAPIGGRLAGLFLMGVAGGLLNTSVFHAIVPAYETNPAATVNLGGVLFGLGCLLSSLFLAGTFYAYSVPALIGSLALIPAWAAWMYARAKFPQHPAPARPGWRETIRDFKSPAAVLFALFLFLQFGNEWALAGWLALFLILRLGISPATALWLLTLYWLVLLLGRVVAQWALPRVSHRRLLAGATVAPMFAFLLLSTTNNLLGAVTGVLLAGGGYAMISPLVVERIGSRFPYFHPGFFSGIFSVALTGAMLAPATLGWYAHYWGVGVVMGLPFLGTVAVFVLMLLMELEARLSGAPGRDV
jgi:FHS family glucose/mannose:H+ symporter-like MFS transporter